MDPPTKQQLVIELAGAQFNWEVELLFLFSHNRFHRLHQKHLFASISRSIQSTTTIHRTESIYTDRKYSAPGRCCSELISLITLLSVRVPFALPLAPSYNSAAIIQGQSFHCHSSTDRFSPFPFHLPSPLPHPMLLLLMLLLMMMMNSIRTITHLLWSCYTIAETWDQAGRQAVEKPPSKRNHQ